MSKPKEDILDLSDLIVDPRISPRKEYDRDVISAWAKKMHAGYVFPPVSVMRDSDGTHYLYDGFYRFYAHRSAAISKINCLIYSGTRDEAIAGAIESNHSHGVMRTEEDVRQAVAMLISLVEWSTAQPRALARKAGCTIELVEMIRKNLPHPDAPKDEARQDADVADSTSGEEENKTKGKGVAKKASKKKAEKEGESPEPITLTEAKEELAEIASPTLPERDRLGRDLPEDLRHKFAASEAMNAFALSLKKTTEDVVALSSLPGGAYLRAGGALEIIKTSILDIAKAVVRATPYAVCPTCSANPLKSPSCKSCGGHGFVTEPIYRALNVKQGQG